MLTAGVPLGYVCVNTATITSTLVDPTPGDNSDSATILVGGPPPIAYFAIGASPDTLLANGVDTSLLTITVTDAFGNGTPYVGQGVTIFWQLGLYPSPVVATLDSHGVGRYTYTAGSTPGTDTITAVIYEGGLPKMAQTTIQLNNNPLVGHLTSEFGLLITYTLVVSTADPLLPQSNLVVSGSIPADTAFVSATGGTHVPNGGDYGWGYVSSPVLPILPPGQPYTLTWTVRPLFLGGSIATQAHAASDTAVLRLTLVKHIYRVLLPFLMRNFAPW